MAFFVFFFQWNNNNQSLTPYEYQRQRLQQYRGQQLIARRPDSRKTIKYALKIISCASVTTAATLLLQLMWIVLKTPRLPPPPLSGVDFVREGRLVRVCGGDDDENGCVEVEVGVATKGSTSTDAKVSDASAKRNTTTSSDGQSNTSQKRREFRLVLIGDSPVEGIGNTHHSHALGGQTASAFAKILRSQNKEYECVRYWSYGKSGLTARGIEEEMVPCLHRVVEDVRSSQANAYCNDQDCVDRKNDNSEEPAVHAIILLCGVNNVLDPVSSASSFHVEVKSLLKSIRSNPGLASTPLIVLGLPDFAKLPFLPWPLSFALGLRGRSMQRMLEMAVKEFQAKEQSRGQSTISMVRIPEIQDALGSIGYHRHDSSIGGANTCNSSADAEDEQLKSGIAQPLKMRLCHPLLKYLGDSSHQLDQTALGSLGIADFLCDDGFHPGRYGTVYIGNLIAEAFEKMVGGKSK